MKKAFHNISQKHFALLAVILLLVVTFFKLLPSQTHGPSDASQLYSDKIASDVVSSFYEQGYVNIIIDLPDTASYIPSDIISVEEQYSSLQNTIIEELGLSERDILHRYTDVPLLAVKITDVAQLENLANSVYADYVFQDYKTTVSDDDVNAGLEIFPTWDTGTTGEDVVIALLDSGITQATWDAYSDRIIDIYCAHSSCQTNEGGLTITATPDSLSSDIASVIDEGTEHGAEMLGIIADIAPDAKFIIIRVHGDDGGGHISDWVKGLEYINAHQEELGVNIINMSLSTKKWLAAGACDSEVSTLTSVIRELRQKGVLTLAATGNNGNSAQISAPACISDVVAVTASYDKEYTDHTLFPDDLQCNLPVSSLNIACFANNNHLTDIAAPGAFITTPILDPANSLYENGLGTSQATAVASGVAALTLSANPYLMPDQLEEILKVSGGDDEDIWVQDSRNDVRVPLINALNAADEAKTTKFDCEEIQEIPVSECEGLASFYNGTQGIDGWEPYAREGWLKSYTPCTDWYGVVCADGHVTALRLDDANLQSSLPYAINKLPELTELRVGGNRLVGLIPDSIMDLEKLKSLNLAYNGLYSLNADVKNFIATVVDEPYWERTQTVNPNVFRPYKTVQARALAPDEITVFWNSILRFNL